MSVVLPLAALQEGEDVASKEPQPVDSRARIATRSYSLSYSLVAWIGLSMYIFKSIFGISGPIRRTNKRL